MSELAPAQDQQIADYPTPDFFGETDPFALFDAWFSQATATEINDPNAVALATVDPSGMPNVRVVLLKGVDGPSFSGRGFSGSGVDGPIGPRRGFVFYTNTESAKGRELLTGGKAALNFHWKSLRRQIRIRGSVAPVPDAEADAYFATRARGSRIGAWASQQSRPLDSRAALEAEIARIDTLYPSDIPRPPHWTGFRLSPAEIEFWCERRYRLHDRMVFSRTGRVEAQAWTTARLNP